MNAEAAIPIADPNSEAAPRKLFQRALTWYALALLLEALVILLFFELSQDAYVQSATFTRFDDIVGARVCFALGGPVVGALCVLGLLHLHRNRSLFTAWFATAAFWVPLLFIAGVQAHFFFVSLTLA